MSNSYTFVAAVAVACVSVFTASAEQLGVGETNAAGEYRPDWAALRQANATISVPQGETWIAYQEDMEYINQADTTLSLPGTLKTTVVFDGTTNWFTRTLNNQSKGIFVKRGSSTAVFTGMNTLNFAGIIRVEEGVLVQKGHYIMAGNYGSPRLIVSDGATFKIAGSYSSHGVISIEVEGNGFVDGEHPNGMGAIWFTGGTSIQHLVLNGDTKIVQDANDAMFSSYTNPGSGAYGTVNPADVTLNGHTLTLAGTSASVGFASTEFPSGNGRVVIEGLAGDAQRILEVSGTGALCGLESVEVPANAILRLAHNATGTNTTTLVAKGDLTITTRCPWENPVRDDDHYRWCGPIQMADGSTLTIAPAAKQYQVNLEGPISGNCDVRVGTSSEAALGFVKFSGANTFTGSFDVYGSADANDFRIYLPSGAVIPDASKYTLHSGNQYQQIFYTDDEGSTSWDEAQILALAKGTGATEVSLDCSALTNVDDIVFTPLMISQYYPDFSAVWNGAGTGGYTLTGPYEDPALLNLSVTDGKVRVTGPGPVNLGTALITGTSATKSGTVIFDNVEVIYGSQTFDVGSRTRAMNTIEPAVAHLILSNATLRSTNSAKHVDVGTGALALGMTSTGILDIYGNSLVSNKLVVGGGKNYYQGSGHGVVRQFGGIVMPRNSGDTHWNSSIGGAGTGYYELHDGVYTNRLAIGVYTTGVFLQLGGRVYAGGFIMSASNGGRSVLTILGGEMEAVSGNPQACMGDSGHFQITVSGEGARLVFGDRAKSYGLFYMNNNTPGYGFVNVNDGGEFQVPGFCDYKAPGCIPPPIRVS